MKSLRTPLAQVKGLGSAKEGTDHFWSQRLTALALVPLVIWLCFAVASLPDMNYVTLREWLTMPFNAIMLIFLMIAGFYHSRLGLQVIIEDYVSTHAGRTVAIVAVTLLAVVFAVIGVFSILRIAFAG